MSVQFGFQRCAEILAKNTGKIISEKGKAGDGLTPHIDLSLFRNNNLKDSLTRKIGIFSIFCKLPCMIVFKIPDSEACVGENEETFHFKAYGMSLQNSSLPHWSVLSF
jgi:hypothetical protein